jgi:hypothetical protein
LFFAIALTSIRARWRLEQLSHFFTRNKLLTRPLKKHG